MRAFTFLLTLLITGYAFAGVETNSVDLTQEAYVPLYDCEIFANAGDRYTCQDLGKWKWRDQGYAVSCSNFTRQDRKHCRVLADNLLYAKRAFDCSYAENQQSCRIVSAAYAKGSFGFYQEAPVIRQSTVINSCGADAYDHAYQRWAELKEKQRRRGQTKAAVGLGVNIIGTLLSTSKNDDTRALGQGLALGGAALTLLGLVEIADADIGAPHLMPGCAGAYIQETRRVVVEERQCVSTRYTENAWGSSRSYYEVRCENHSYVTFERFTPYEESRVVIRGGLY